MKNRQSAMTAVVLACASELVKNVAEGVLGNEVADTFNGSPLTRGVLHNLAQAKFQSLLANHLGGK